MNPTPLTTKDTKAHKELRKAHLAHHSKPCAHRPQGMKPRHFLLLMVRGGMLFTILGMLFAMQPHLGMSMGLSACEKPGWFPKDFGLKDHTVFQHDGYTYIASIYLPREKQFAYGRSQNLCDWEDLGPILTERNSGAWDEMAVWAPYVFEDNGIFYMYYTGVTRNFTQSIMLATSTDPANPASWQEQGMIFQPTHPGTDWSAGTWADCRDPHVLLVEDTYYLYYTGRDHAGGMVGVALASSPTGPWQDLGAIFTPSLEHNFESPAVFQHQNLFYLVYHKNFFGQSQGGFSLISETPKGPFRQPSPFFPGWAHEIWRASPDTWMTSYLTNYSVTIKPLGWNEFLHPSRPFVGAQVYGIFLPLTLHAP